MTASAADVEKVLADRGLGKADYVLWFGLIPFLISGGYLAYLAARSVMVAGGIEPTLVEILPGPTAHDPVNQVISSEELRSLVACLSTVLSELENRGYTLSRLGEYGIRPRVQLAGIDPLGGLRTGVSDSRSDQGTLAQRVP